MYMLVSLYNTAINSLKAPSPALLESAFAVAVASSDESLLSSIARFPGLPAHMEAHIAKSSSAKVQVARFSRPGMSQEVITKALQKEKRASVLAVIAATQDLPEAVYKQLATTKQRAVAVALLDNANVPTEHLTQVASFLAASFDNLPYKVQYLVLESLSADRIDSQKVFETADSTLRARMITSSHKLSKEQQLGVINGDLEYMLTEARTSNGYRKSQIERHLCGLVKSLLLSTNDPDCVTALVLMATKLAAAGVKDLELSLALDSREKDAAHLLDRHNLAKTSTDPAVVNDLVEFAINHHDPDVASLLLTNKAVGLHAVSSLCRWVPGPRLVEALIERDCLETASLCATHVYRPEDLLALLSHFEAGLLPALARDSSTRRLFEEPAASVYALEFILGSTFDQVRTLLSSYNATAPAVLTDALALSLEMLPPERCAVLTSVANNWAGTIADLVALSDALESTKA